MVCARSYAVRVIRKDTEDVITEKLMVALMTTQERRCLKIKQT